MISKYKVENLTFETPTNATICEQYDWTKKGYKNTMRIHIKKYMPRFEMDTPKETTVVMPSNIFANNNQTKPTLSKNILKELNYMTGTYTQDQIKDLSKIATPVKNKDGVIVGSVIPKGSAVRCYFKNGMLSKLMLQTDILNQPFADMQTSDLLARDILNETK